MAEQEIVKQELVKQTTAAQTNYNRNRNVQEIDLLELFGEFKKHIVAIVAVGLLFGILAGLYFKFFVPAQYESTSVLYVLSKETTLTSLADLQIGTQLTSDYKTIITSRPVLEEVIKNLNLDMTYQQLEDQLTIENPSSTRILQITAKDTDPQMAKKKADEVACVASDYIADIMELIPPKIIEEGEVPKNKCYPSVAKNAFIAALLGMMLVCGLITLDFIMDDTIKTAEDVKKYVDLPVLAMVNYSEEEDDEKNGSKEKKGKFLPAGFRRGLEKLAGNQENHGK